MDDAAARSETRFLADQRDDRPFANEAVVLSKLDYIELKAQCHSYKALFERALAREADLSMANSNFKLLLATEIVRDNASSTDSR